MIDSDLSQVLRTTKGHLNRLKEMGIRSPRHLLAFFPWRYSDESEFCNVADLKIDEIMTVRGRLSKIFARKSVSGKHMLRAKFADSTGEIEVLWFNQPYLRQILKEGMEIILSGKIKFDGSRTSFIGPKYEIPRSGIELTHTGRLVPVYHENDKISSKWLREKIHPILYMTKYLADPLPLELVEEYGLMTFEEAVKQVHFPESEELLRLARYRLGFNELFFIQLRVLQRKRYWSELAAQCESSIDTSKKCVQQFLDNLPFTLTDSQVKALSEISMDLAKPHSMSRLLEGDVGSGKTVIAEAAVFMSVKSGYQAAIMVPTEILARQHLKNIYRDFQKFGFNIQLLTGSMSKSQKEKVYKDCRLGLVDVVVGTHALIQEDVGFMKLGLAVIDEQHRFGVSQRAILKKFGSPHILSMTATPIPRTLALTLYGDQELSIIDELPPNRQVIITRIVPEKRRKDAYLWISDQVKMGRQAFVICPLIEESETLEVKSAIDEFERLAHNVFSEFKVGLLHGRLKQADKDLIMEQFANDEIDILVSTTVVEVGIDVPNATIMLIEAADRFGLAQLHQLRGRVGRGAEQSYCFLFTESDSEMSRKRMDAMVKFSSGFKLAEIDLQLRGPGEVYGMRQSGIPDLKMASLTDFELIKVAREAAEKIMAQDSTLEAFSELKGYVTSSEVEIDY